jgi:hypothetical protein
LFAATPTSAACEVTLYLAVRSPSSSRVSLPASLFPSDPQLVTGPAPGPF